MSRPLIVFQLSLFVGRRLADGTPHPLELGRDVGIAKSGNLPDLLDRQDRSRQFAVVDRFEQRQCPLRPGTERFDGVAAIRFAQMLISPQQDRGRFRTVENGQPTHGDTRQVWLADQRFE